MAENDAHYNGTFDMDTQIDNETMWTNGSYEIPAPFPSYGERGFLNSSNGTPGQKEANGSGNAGTLPMTDENSADTFPESTYNDMNTLPQSDENSAVTLPESGENGAVTLPESGGNGAVTLPESGGNGSVTLPESGENGAVTLPESGNGVVAPLPEFGEGGPVSPGPEWMPGFPTFPVIPPQYYGQVRFLNASANSFPVNISIDGTAYAINSRFGTISNYDWISDGFHTVTVRRASGVRSVLLQQNFPFVAGQKVTMVLTDSAVGGLDLIRIVDTGCSNMALNTGCYRFANMAYSGSCFDLMLYGGETVFRNVGFQTVTSYKQAMAGTYQFYVTNSNTYSTFLRELPVIVIGAMVTNTNAQQPLVSFQTDINSGQNYTTYMIGNIWSDTGLTALTVED